MTFVVEIERRVKINQGLTSPVRAQAGLPALDAGEGISLVMKIGVQFNDGQLNDRGWFLDTDAVGLVVEEYCSKLAGSPWTQLFDFRPTFELVARHIFHQLRYSISQLVFVELRDESFGSLTRYLEPFV